MWNCLWSIDAPPLWGVFCRQRVGLAGGLLPDLHTLDTREGLTGAVLPGMISGDRVIMSYSRLGQTFLLCTNIIHDTNEKIKVVRDGLKAAQSRQKSYTDVRRNDLVFQVGDWVFLKLSH
ncbi:hypothetical protein ACLB2K_006767 [Fragaria x ananassa]